MPPLVYPLLSPPTDQPSVLTPSIQVERYFRVRKEAKCFHPYGKMFDKRPWDWQWDLEEGSLPRLPDLITALQGHDDLNALVPGKSLRADEPSAQDAWLAALDCVRQLLRRALDKCSRFVALQEQAANTSRSGDCVSDEMQYAVTGPQKVTREAELFTLQVWAMVEAQVERFTRLIHNQLREQTQHAGDLSELEAFVTKLEVEVRVSGCTVQPSQATLRWNRKIQSTLHVVSVPHGFAADAFQCSVVIEAPELVRFRAEFEQTFSIARGTCASAQLLAASAQLLAANSSLSAKVIQLEAQVTQLGAWTCVPPELSPAVVCIGVARPLTPSSSSSLPSMVVAGVQHVISVKGTGWFFDPRGLVFTCEHVRRACRRLLAAHSGVLVVCPVLDGGAPDWQAHAWSARVLAHTRHWDGTAPTAGESEPAADVVSLPGANDAAVLWVQEHLGSSTPVSNPVLVHTVPIPTPITTLTLGDPLKLQSCQRLFVLGFPTIGGLTLTPTGADYCGAVTEADGRWLKLHGLMSRGHSGGPVLAQQATGPPSTAGGVVVGWNVRTPVTDDAGAGLNHARPVDEAAACMTAAQLHPALPVI